MSVRCPVCRHHLRYRSLRKRFVCKHCAHALRARLAAPILIFLALAAIINGFILLVWWALLQPEAGQARLMAYSLSLTRLPILPLVLGVSLSWGLFHWVFSALALLTAEDRQTPNWNLRTRGRAQRTTDASA